MIELFLKTENSICGISCFISIEQFIQENGEDAWNEAIFIENVVLNDTAIKVFYSEPAEMFFSLNEDHDS